MPVPGPGDTIALRAVELNRVSNLDIIDGRVAVNLIVRVRNTRDRVASITMKAWEVKPNQWVPGLVSLTFTFDSESDLTFFLHPSHIEWAAVL